MVRVAAAPSPNRVLAVTAAVTTACVLPSFLLGAMAVQVRRDLGFAESGVGYAFAVFFGAASLASAPTGRLAERLGPIRSLRMAAWASAAGTIVVATTAQSLLGIMVPMAVAGAANALCQPAANLLVARSVPADRQGFAFAVKQAAVPFSTLLAGAAVPGLALTVGWRWAFVLAALLAFVSGALVSGLPGPAGSAAAAAAAAAVGESGGGRRGRGRVGRGRGRGRVGRGRGRGRRGRGRGRGGPRGSDVPFPVMATLSVGIAFGAAAGGTLGSFLVSAAVDGGLSEGGAGWLLTVGSVVGIAVRLLAGMRADRRDGGHLRVVAIMLVAGAGAFALLAVNEPWSYLVAGPLAFCTAWAWPGLFNLAVVRANPTRPAAATGITQTGTYIGAVSGPLLFGVIADHTSFRAAWMVAVVLALLASVAMVVGRRRLRAWKATAGPGVDIDASVTL